MVAAVLFGCQCSDLEDGGSAGAGGGSDASMGASGGEAGNDATDASARGGSDASGGGSGAGGRWAGWDAVIGTPPDCVVYVPKDVDASVSPLTWSECPNAPGCVRLDTPWQVGRIGALDVRTVLSKYGGDEGLQVAQHHGLERYVVATFDLDDGGRPLAALGFDGDYFCFGDNDAWQGRLLFSTSHSVGDGDVQYDFYFGPFDSPSTYAAPIVSGRYASGWGILQAVIAGDSLFATKLAGEAIGVYDVASETLSYVETPANGYREKYVPAMAGDWLTFVDGDLSGSLWIRHPDGNTQKLRELEASANIASQSTDGVQIAWVEARSPSSDGPYLYDDTELWVSPFATTSAELRPRRLTRTTPTRALSTSMVVNDGQAALHGSEVRVYDLADGSYRTLPAEPVPVDGFRSTQMKILWVDSTEVVTIVGFGAHPQTIVRIRLDSLARHPAEP